MLVAELLRVVLAEGVGLTAALGGTGLVLVGVAHHHDGAGGAAQHPF